MYAAEKIRNHKSQATKSKQEPKFKIANRFQRCSFRSLRVLSLGFVWPLPFGAWDFALARLLALEDGRRLQPQVPDDGRGHVGEHAFAADLIGTDVAVHDPADAKQPTPLLRGIGSVTGPGPGGGAQGAGATSPLPAQPG